MRSVLFVTDQWGYGTTTMAIAIAAELGGRARCDFAGSGPAHGLARRSSFARVAEMDTMAEAVAGDLRRLIGEHDLLVSVMNRQAARLAGEAGIPCVYVDCLLWMWHEAPPVASAAAFFQEAFPGAARRLSEWADRLPDPHLVGPIIAARPARLERSRDTVLVNFGGLSSWLVDQEKLIRYAETMTDCVAEALADWSGRTIISAGSHVLDRLDTAALRSFQPNAELKDLAHDEYLRELGRSRLLVSSAGMHALYEAFEWEVPCAYLPSQNLSQVQALDALESEAVAPVLDWKHLYGLDGLHASAEREATERILGCADRFRCDAAARARLVGYLRSFLSESTAQDVVAKQSRFLDELGPRGAPVIADHVMALLDG